MRTQEGKLGITAHYSMIIKIAGVWWEIWCPFCGINATKGYRIHHLRAAAGLGVHMKAKHGEELPPPANGKWSDEDTLMLAGKEKMFKEDMEELISGEVVPRLVHKPVEKYLMRRNRHGRFVSAYVSSEEEEEEEEEEEDEEEVVESVEHGQGADDEDMEDVM